MCTHTIGQYLLEQLLGHGVRHVFGVPGDYVLGLYDLMVKGPVEHIGTTREDSAGYAADAYARITGLGAACVTYCVGGFNVVNPIACAYAERSPVLLISGSPGLGERERDPMLHHRVGPFSTQLDVFTNITVAAVPLDDPNTAHRLIDDVLHAVQRYQLPGYIEVPRDMVDVARPHVHRDVTLEDITDQTALEECIAEAVEMINAAEHPVILAGVETHRFKLQEALLELVERTRIPVAATVLGKSVIRESHPLYLGVYEGAMGQSAVQEYVENADCILMLGCFMTDINLGLYTADLDRSLTISATAERLSVRSHSYHNVPYRSFFHALLQAPIRRREEPALPSSHDAPTPATDPSEAITMSSLFAVLNGFIDDSMAVVCDVGDCLFGAVDLEIASQTRFVSPAYYTSMGFAVPGAIGVQMADASLRPLVLVGDGAFQMTGMELSTAARLGLNPIVVVLNNKGYSTERQILEGPFNDIQDWRYHQVPDVIGAGAGHLVRTPAELSAALKESLGADELRVIEVELDPYDISRALRRLGRELGKRVRG